MFDNSRSTTAFAGEQLTVSSSALGGTSTVYAPVVSGTLRPNGPRARKCLLSVESNSVRVRWDGTDPTAAVGHLLLPGDLFVVDGAANVGQLRMIRVGSDATVQLTYER